MFCDLHCLTKEEKQFPRAVSLNQIFHKDTDTKDI